MPERRPDIPATLQREVETEAGHRCAIPTCKATPIEIAHIEPWSKVREHTFENLVALCPNCHSRYDAGQIDRKSMLIYKANLRLIAGRYGEMEQRVLWMFGDNPGADFVDLPGGLQLFFFYLLRDGFLVDAGMAPWATQIQGVNTYDRYRLTPAGRDLITRWLSAEQIT